MEPAEFCAVALAHLDDWAPVAADRAAVAVLLAHFARARPSEPLFVESLRALARDRGNGSLATAAAAIRDEWRAALARGQSAAAPVRLRPEDRPVGLPRGVPAREPPAPAPPSRGVGGPPAAGPEPRGAPRPAGPPKGRGTPR